MSTKAPKPKHQPETEFNGELQEFSGPVLSPDDPTLEPRIRRGRPAESEHGSEKEKDTQEQD